MKRLSNFSYLVQDRIAGSAHPGQGRLLGENLAELQRVGFKAILTLTEDPLDLAMLREFGFDALHLPIRDFGAPSLAQVEEAIEFLSRHSRTGGRVLIHCFGGFGRTGTILACHLVNEGMSAGDAIREVRRLRPGSIEDSSQEDLIFDYERHLKQRRREAGHSQG
ncbi:dual specificity protein phosphatase family protein [Candidatus Sumerlaeota bacterium]|nr:dual specificity protein phosphatase family protein [Candidatus Sumerlaeota bacterium]